MADCEGRNRQVPLIAWQLGPKCGQARGYEPKLAVAFNGKALVKDVDYILSLRRECEPWQGYRHGDRRRGWQLYGLCSCRVRHRKEGGARACLHRRGLLVLVPRDAVTFVAFEGPRHGLLGGRPSSAWATPSRAGSWATIWLGATPAPDEYASYDPETRRGHDGGLRWALPTACTTPRPPTGP